jgi:hypothetical protein
MGAAREAGCRLVLIIPHHNRRAACLLVVAGGGTPGAKGSLEGQPKPRLLIWHGRAAGTASACQSVQSRPLACHDGPGDPWSGWNCPHAQ